MLKSVTPYVVGIALVASALASTETRAQGKVAQAVAGKLVKVEGKKVKAYRSNASPKYYVLYHSASW